MLVVDNDTQEHFWMEGDDEDEARSSIGQDVTITHMVALPKDELEELESRL